MTQHARIKKFVKSNTFISAINRLRAKISIETKLVLAMTFGLSILSYSVRHIARPSDNIIHIFATGLPGLMFLWLVCVSMRRWPFWLIFILGPPLGMFIEALHWEIETYTSHHYFTWQGGEYSTLRYAFSIYLWSFYHLTWYWGYFAILHYFKYTREAQAASEARALMHQTQLQTLRYQINPHFLFNTLNSISTLVLDQKNAKAENMIGSLSRVLRFSLDNPSSHKIKLADEIHIAKEYLAIESMRFSDKLNTEFQLQPETLEYLIPSLTLQPMLESMIKHTIAPAKTKSTIRISSRLDEHFIILTVSSNSTTSEYGTYTKEQNFEHIRKRLKTIYKDQARLEISNEKNSGIQTCLFIPLEHPHKPDETTPKDESVNDD